MASWPPRARKSAWTTAAGSPTQLQDKHATWDGPVRYTAPSLVFERDDRRLEAGGWQPVEAYDVCVANLLPDGERRGVPDDVGLLLERFPDGLVTQEVALLLTRGNDAVDRPAAEAALLGLVAERRARRVPVGDDALWLRTTTFGDDKDRVLIKSDGEPTYLAADVAYHWDKLERGFNRLINVLGADHHGYVARVRAAIAALGGDPDAFEAQIMNLVHVVEGGERVQMSKRSGDFVSLDDLLEDIGVDATRWFMLWRSHETAVDLDLTVARSQSNENPVYYVQYAHARIASILRKAGAAAEAAAEGPGAPAGTALEPSEKALIKRLLEFPDEVRESAKRRAPHRICAYSTAVAADFHAFYRDCQVVGAEGEGVERSRLALCLAAKRTIAAALGLLGISAPERM